jgi:hypothetical protein
VHRSRSHPRVLDRQSSHYRLKDTKASVTQNHDQCIMKERPASEYRSWMWQPPLSGGGSQFPTGRELPPLKPSDFHVELFTSTLLDQELCTADNEGQDSENNGEKCSESVRVCDETSHCKTERSDSAKKPRISGQTLNPQDVAVAR